MREARKDEEVQRRMKARNEQLEAENLRKIPKKRPAESNHEEEQEE